MTHVLLALRRARFEEHCHLIEYAGRSLTLLCRKHASAAEQRNEHWTEDTAASSSEKLPLDCSVHLGIEKLDHVLRFGDIRSPSLRTTPNALVTSMKATCKGICCSLHLSCSCQRAKSTYTVDLSDDTLWLIVDKLYQNIESDQYDLSNDFADNAD